MVRRSSITLLPSSVALRAGLAASLDVRTAVLPPSAPPCIDDNNGDSELMFDEGDGALQEIVAAIREREDASAYPTFTGTSVFANGEQQRFPPYPTLDAFGESPHRPDAIGPPVPPAQSRGPLQDAFPTYFPECAFSKADIARTPWLKRYSSAVTAFAAASIPSKLDRKGKGKAKARVRIALGCQDGCIRLFAGKDDAALQDEEDQESLPDQDEWPGRDPDWNMGTRPVTPIRSWSPVLDGDSPTPVLLAQDESPGPSRPSSSRMLLRLDSFQRIHTPEPEIFARRNISQASSTSVSASRASPTPDIQSRQHRSSMSTYATPSSPTSASTILSLNGDDHKKGRQGSVLNQRKASATVSVSDFDAEALIKSPTDHTDDVNGKGKCKERGHKKAKGHQRNVSLSVSALEAVTVSHSHPLSTTDHNDDELGMVMSPEDFTQPENGFDAAQSLSLAALAIHEVDSTSSKKSSQTPSPISPPTSFAEGTISTPTEGHDRSPSQCSHRSSRRQQIVSPQNRNHHVAHPLSVAAEAYPTIDEALDEMELDIEELNLPESQVPVTEHVGAFLASPTLLSPPSNDHPHLQRHNNRPSISSLRKERDTLPCDAWKDTALNHVLDIIPRPPAASAVTANSIDSIVWLEVIEGAVHASEDDFDGRGEGRALLCLTESGLLSKFSLLDGYCFGHVDVKMAAGITAALFSHAFVLRTTRGTTIMCCSPSAACCVPVQLTNLSIDSSVSISIDSSERVIKQVDILVTDYEKLTLIALVESKPSDSNEIAPESEEENNSLPLQLVTFVLSQSMEKGWSFGPAVMHDVLSFSSPTPIHGCGWSEDPDFTAMSTQGSRILIWTGIEVQYFKYEQGKFKPTGCKNSTGSDVPVIAARFIDNDTISIIDQVSIRNFASRTSLGEPPILEEIGTFLLSAVENGFVVPTTSEGSNILLMIRSIYEESDEISPVQNRRSRSLHFAHLQHANLSESEGKSNHTTFHTETVYEPHPHDLPRPLGSVSITRTLWHNQHVFVGDDTGRVVKMSQKCDNLPWSTEACSDQHLSSAITCFLAFNETLLAGTAAGTLGFLKSTNLTVLEEDAFASNPVVSIVSIFDPLGGEGDDMVNGWLAISGDGCMRLGIVCNTIPAEGINFKDYSLPRYDLAIRVVAVCKDPLCILSIYNDGSVRKWDLSSHEPEEQVLDEDKGWALIDDPSWITVIGVSNKLREDNGNLCPADDTSSALVDLRSLVDTASCEASASEVTLSTVRSLFSQSMAWGINPALDDCLTQQLRIPASASPASLLVAFGNGSLISVPPREAFDSWTLSPRHTAYRLVLLTVLLRIFLNDPSHERYASEATVALTLLPDHIGPMFISPSLEVFLKYWFDDNSDVRDATRLLFGAYLAKLSDQQVVLFSDAWQARLPTNSQNSTNFNDIRQAESTLMLGLIAIDRYKSLSTVLLKQLSISVFDCIKRYDSVYHQAVAIEVCSKAFAILQNYVDAMELVRALFALATGRDPSTLNELRVMARHATLHVAAINTPLFMTTLSYDILSAKEASHRVATMKLVAFMVRKKPLVLHTSLPRLAEAVVKSLDPTFKLLRDATQSAATLILHELVKTYPSISFHGKSQRLAVGTPEGAVIVYDVRTATRLYILEGHRSSVTAVTWSPDGHRLVSVSLDDGRADVWKMGSGLLGYLPRQAAGGVVGNLIAVSKGASNPTGPYKAFPFNVGDEANMSVAATLEWVVFEWPGERNCRLRIRESSLTFAC